MPWRWPCCRGLIAWRSATCSRSRTGHIRRWCVTLTCECLSVRFWGFPAEGECKLAAKVSGALLLIARNSPAIQGHRQCLIVPAQDDSIGDDSLRTFYTQQLRELLSPVLWVLNAFPQMLCVPAQMLMQIELETLHCSPLSSLPWCQMWATCNPLSGLRSVRRPAC